MSRRACSDLRVVLDSLLESGQIDMSVNQLILILRSRWRLALGVFAAILFMAIAFTFLSAKQYTAIASVVIDSKTDPVSAAGFTDQLLTSYVNTQADVIASQRVAQRVVKALKLDELPQLQKAWRSKTQGQGDITVWIADFLLQNKVVVGTGKAKNSNIINIAAKWSDPKLAAAVANAFAQAAIDVNIELKIEPAKQFAKWFDQRSVALHEALQAKQKRLSDFENATGITATDEKLDVENARLAELSTQLVEIQGQRQDSQSRQRQVSANNESLPEVLQSPVIAKLKSDLSDAEARQADIAGRLGKNHPDYQAAVTEVSSLHSRIQQESAKIAGALGSNAQINVRRENEVRLALEEQRKRVLDLKHQHDEAAVLQNDVTTAQRDLDAVTQRLAQSSLESQEQQTNMVQLTTATEPFVPSSPKLFLNVLAGVFLGAILGVAAALMAERKDPRMRDDVQLLQLLGVPILVKIGSVNTRNLRGGESVQSTPQLESSAI
jgi:chain length determinant protein EpsF